ncbi:hypothetical protein P691DRAFT_713673 [Macrolepiota fuliginosa MF-IS2]|uniref:DUF6593 domain-containing protein n=1 Tax=Macrolepiota fuliginosa MF-IS2 TaxID=1400762 RepID=A0A9P5X273_9AGAR|nr:hypothetical protein P691DRAFT_713673 [Macrolepiota fuliginosa MF-IS2]
MSLGPSNSQITLTNPTFDDEPALVLLLNPDNVKKTIMTRLGGPHSGEVLYKVESNASLTKCSVFRPNSDVPIALIKRRDLFPDKITLEGERERNIKSWLQGYGTFKDFPISFEKDEKLYHWRTNIVDQLALFKDDNSEHPIAWFERSKKRVVDGVPTIFQAWLALEPEAIAIQDAVIVSFLIIEHKLRTDIKAGHLVGGRAAAFIV